jgi:hypothetical protein
MDTRITVLMQEIEKKMETKGYDADARQLCIAVRALDLSGISPDLRQRLMDRVEWLEDKLEEKACC